MPSRRIFVSHDGAIDDFVAALLVPASPDVEIAGVSIVDADCLAEPALAVQRKLLALTGREGVEISLSRARAFNPFPWGYRADCLKLADLAALRSVDDPGAARPAADGEERLRSALARGPLTILATGPLTPLQLALEDSPEAAERIERVVWMGGAIDVPGNLDPATLPGLPLNRAAEWNAFWDPFAVDWLLRKTAIPLTVVPLDVCDRLPIDAAVLDRLRGADGPLARFVGEAYALVAAQPFYRMWDVAAAAALLSPDLFAAPARLRLEAVTRGAEQGALRRSEHGREVDVVLEFGPRGPAGVYDWLTATLTADSRAERP